MSIVSFVFLGIFAALFLYAATMYNNFVRLKNNVSEAWSNIDVLLKQRHDELPKLIETCKQYMQHERGVLEKVTEARAAVHNARVAGDVNALGGAEDDMRAGLARLFAVSENYPELRANEDFQRLQDRISQLEAQIADRREFYNDTVNANNIRIEQFPDNVIATLFRFEPKFLLKFKIAETQDVDVKAMFSN
ncbi:MAG: LemA family protein [Sulfuricaulis sp.]